MKSSLLITVLFFFICNTSFSQNDSIFPNLRGEWEIQYRNYEINPNDYLISSLKLRKLDENYDTMGLYSYPRFNNFEEMLIAKIYTDSLKVYANLCSQEMYIDDFFINYSPSLSNQYELLYDFSLEVGDTFFMRPILEGYSIVQSIQFENINNSIRKKIIFDGGSDTWIQGLGSKYHPLYPVIGFCWECSPIICSATMEFEGNSSVDTFIYDEMKSSCIYNASLNEEKLKLVKMYPNPSEHEFNIESQNELDEIKIYNIDGICVYQDKLSGFKQQITPNLSSGVYIVKIKTINNKVLTHKIIMR
jgi:hypothetical protein